MSNPTLDNAVITRKGEELDQSKLEVYLQDVLGKNLKINEIKQFPSGYSNLTYLLETNQGEYVLRKPPHGANIKGGHDMHREFRVLSALKPIFPYVPNPINYSEEETLLGTPFYVMERISGIILRAQPPKGLNLSKDFFNSIANSSVDLLARLHKLDLDETGLADMGKPEGYVKRQVEGWVKRYFNAKTDELKEMEACADWLLDWVKQHENDASINQAAFIHNDFKYDNLVLTSEAPYQIKAILDWEMATVGHPLMDLGTTLAYWCEATDHPALKAFNLTWMEGNLTRKGVLKRYQQQTNMNVDGILFYYIFGCFKVAVIGQQIYSRYKKGLTKDPRFGALIHVIEACGKNTQLAIKFNRINNFY
jgi:aminoglycoside phosphotransferase (APT) family kinase protein